MARKSKVVTEKKAGEQEGREAVSREKVELASFSVEYRSRCGGALRLTREKMGLTTQEVASRLRLSSKQIEALEADHFDDLPETTIVKGFIRNYAKLLKINAEPLLDAYNVIVPERPPQSFTLHPSLNMSVKDYEQPNSKRYLLVGLLIFLCAGFWFFYQNYVQKPSPVTPTANLEQPVPAEPEAGGYVSDDDTVITLPNAGTVEADNIDVPSSAGSDDTVVITDEVMAEPVPTEPASAAEVSPLTPQPPTVFPAPEQASAAALSKLEFNASQETWISVTDASGMEVYSKILFPGNREVIDAKPPLSVVVGNAHGTSLVVNGKPVDLGPHTRINVARIKLD